MARPRGQATFRGLLWQYPTFSTHSVVAVDLGDGINDAIGQTSPSDGRRANDRLTVFSPVS